ncbi:hypothetical protein D6C85_02289 [Aureobasidium pullulans]|uniref:Uncharacterized protein n=1 Tax=Aureobasidium pullulans TaxID=5580 RepID=A0A4S9XD94_AURPU|nr:hypothetical protein D6C85_02289 [Aureobasidium pullulans]
MARSRLIPQEKTNLGSRSVVKTQRKKEVFNRFKTPVRQHMSKNNRNLTVLIRLTVMQIENASRSRVERLEGIEGLCGSDAQCPIDLTGDGDVPHSSSAGHSSDAEDLDRLSVENGEPSPGPSRDADNASADCNARSLVQDAVRSGPQAPEELDDEEDTGDAAARTPWNVEQFAVLRPRVVQQAVVSDYQNDIEMARQHQQRTLRDWAALQVKQAKERRKDCHPACNCHKLERLRESQNQSMLCECHNAGLYHRISGKFEDAGGFDARGWPIMTRERRRRWWAEHWSHCHRVVGDEELVNMWYIRTPKQRHQGAPWAFDIKGGLYQEMSYLEPLIHARGLEKGGYVVVVSERRNGGRQLGRR